MKRMVVQYETEMMIYVYLLSQLTLTFQLLMIIGGHFYFLCSVHMVLFESQIILFKRLWSSFW